MKFTLTQWNQIVKGLRIAATAEQGRRNGVEMTHAEQRVAYVNAQNFTELADTIEGSKVSA